MRKLHLVGFTPDNGGLIFAARRGAKTGGYVVALEPELMEQIEAARRLRRGGGSDGGIGKSLKIESALTPREIQARMRIGRSVEEVAAEAGVTVEWVERFAAPIFAEQAAAVARASQLTMETPRRGSSDRPLARAVFRNLALKGVRLTEEEFAASWSAHMTVDNEWLVSFRFFSRGRASEAEWIFDGKVGRLLAHNRIGTELGFVDSGSRASSTRSYPQPAGGEEPEIAPSGDARRAARALSSIRESSGATSHPARKSAAARKSAVAARKSVPARKATVAVKKAPALGKVSGAAKAKKAAPIRKVTTTAKKAATSQKRTTAKKAVATRKPAPTKKRAAPARRTAAVKVHPVAASTAPKTAPVKRLSLVPSSPPSVSLPRRERPLRAPRFANVASDVAPEPPVAQDDTPIESMAVVAVAGPPDVDRLRPPRLQEIPVPPPLPPVRRRHRFDDIDLGVEYLEVARRRVGVQLS